MDWAAAIPPQSALATEIEELTHEGGRSPAEEMTIWIYDAGVRSLLLFQIG